MNVTYCPAVSDSPQLHFDQAQFAARQQYAVGARYVGINNGKNGFESTALSYGDYGNMQTYKRKCGVGHERRLATPAFMLDQARFRSVVLRYLELRVQLRQPEGTEVERLQKLTSAMKRQAEQCMAQIDEWALDYVTNPSDAERKRLQRLIGERDTLARICREPWVIPQMARCYYFEGLDSVTIGDRLGFKAPHVRQILYRLGRLGAEMQEGRRLPNGFRAKALKTLR